MFIVVSSLAALIYSSPSWNVNHPMLNSVISCDIPFLPFRRQSTNKGEYMIQDFFSLITEGNTIADSFTITVTLENGTFNIDRFAEGVYFGEPHVPPGTTPYGYFTVKKNSLIYSGTLNGLLWEAYVQSQDPVLVGTIRVADRPLPVEIRISSEGGKGQFILRRMVPFDHFKIPIANAPTESEAERTSRIAKIIGRTE
jgi:hypothetical protein